MLDPQGQTELVLCRLQTDRDTLAPGFRFWPRIKIYMFYFLAYLLLATLKHSLYFYTEHTRLIYWCTSFHFIKYSYHVRFCCAFCDYILW